MRIAKIELNTMFYSPVAWLIVVVFAFQAGWTYSELLNELIHRQAMGEELSGLTGKLLGEESFFGVMSENNFFSRIANYLYLYMPLMTMGLLSKEYSSGSVKLLFSVPISNRSIVLGKFAAIMTFGSILLSIVVGYIIYSGLVIEHFDWGHAWAGVLGIFLLMGAYAAIGLFVSSLTIYPVVAAIGTLAALTVLNYIGSVGQDIGFIRDVTYWLALSGKTRDFTLGMIPSESLLYFLSLTCFFLYITLLRLEDQRMQRGRCRMWIRYGMAVTVLVCVSWVTSRPVCKFYTDWTTVQVNTLSQESQEIIDRVKGKLKITTYVNILDNYVWQLVLPKSIKEDMKRFERYTRFKPEVEMEYVYYWDEANNAYLKELYPDLSNRERAEFLCMVNGVDFDELLTPEQIKEHIDLSRFGNRVIRVLESENGRCAYLPIYTGHDMFATETELTAVFKHLTGERMKVCFVEKHGDRSILNRAEGGYWWSAYNFFYRSSLLAMGFDVEPLDLRCEEIPATTEILVVPPLKTPLSAEEREKVDAYVAAGGNLFVLSEQGFQENANVVLADLGVRFTNEVAVCASQNPTVIMAKVAEEAYSEFSGLSRIAGHSSLVAQKDVAAIDYGEVRDFKVTPVVVSEQKGVWLEKEDDLIGEEAVVLNAEAGESEGVYPFMVGMERQLGNKKQRILLASDPCWFNGEHYRRITGPKYANARLVPVLMRWLADGVYPIAAERTLPVDNAICLKNRDRKYNSLVMLGVLPIAILLAGGWLIKRRKRV